MKNTVKATAQAKKDLCLRVAFVVMDYQGDCEARAKEYMKAGAIPIDDVLIFKKDLNLFWARGLDAEVNQRLKWDRGRTGPKRSKDREWYLGWIQGKQEKISSIASTGRGWKKQVYNWMVSDGCTFRQSIAYQYIKDSFPKL